jgi:hypothetical protein
MWGVLVQSQVRSWSHHLTHQWSQISIIAFGNHIMRHYIYSKNSHVRIQVFHILHNYTMKSLQAFKSFLKWKSIVDNQQWNLFCWWHRIRQQKLICWWHRIRQQKLICWWHRIWQWNLVLRLMHEIINVLNLLLTQKS